MCSETAAVDSVDAEESAIPDDETASAEAAWLVSETRVTAALISLSITEVEEPEAALAAGEASDDSTLGGCVDEEAGGRFWEEADCFDSWASLSFSCIISNLLLKLKAIIKDH